jgi:hypothetical protein
VTLRARFGLIFLGAIARALIAATTPPAPPPVNHDFDFWLGEWSVTTPDGKPAGTNRIESISNGYGLLENWSADPAAGGGTGKSLNAYNAAKKQWQQFWIGGRGGILELSGGLDAHGNMRLTGSQVTANGGKMINRITWTPNADGSVRQLWETSVDDGKTWSVAFDGHYVRKK